MELPSIVKNQMEKLVLKKAFLENIPEYVRAGINTITSGNESINEQCPTALLLGLSHCLHYNLPFTYLADIFPQESRTQFLNACRIFSLQVLEEEFIFKEAKRSNLCNMNWQMEVEGGREKWKICLLFENGTNFQFRLTYEQLSVLVFKLGQAVAFVQNYKP